MSFKRCTACSFTSRRSSLSIFFQALHSGLVRPQAMQVSSVNLQTLIQGFLLLMGYDTEFVIDPLIDIAKPVTHQRMSGIGKHLPDRPVADRETLPIPSILLLASTCNSLAIGYALS